MASGASSSSDDDSLDRKAKHGKKKDKKGKHAEHRKSKKDKKDKKDIKTKKKDKTRGKTTRKKGGKRKSSSLSVSTSSERKPRKSSHKRKANEVQERWILGREAAIRKADPHISEEEALRTAVAEYCELFGDTSNAGEPTAATVSHDTSEPEPKIKDERVAEAVADAVHDARVKAEAAGRSRAEVEEAVKEARDSVLRIAEQAGLYNVVEDTPGEKLSLFLAEKEREQEEYIRLGVPSTDDRPRERASVRSHPGA